MPGSTKFPDKPVRIINPFRPGGFSDVVVNAMTPKFAALLGAEIKIEYMPGVPGGRVAPEYVAASEADGQTLLIGTIGNIALLPAIYPGYKINPLTDLAPISLLAEAADILVTHPASPIKSLDDMIAAAKERPGTLTYNAVNPGSIHYLEMKLLIDEAGIELAKPIFGGKPFEDILSGRVDLFVSTPANIIPRIREGRLRPLAIFARDRAPALPGVPTLPDAGFPSLHTGSWTGLFAAAGTPGPVIEALSDAARAAVHDGAVTEAAAKMAMAVRTHETPADFTAFLASETARLAGGVKLTDIPII